VLYYMVYRSSSSVQSASSTNATGGVSETAS